MNDMKLIEGTCIDPKFIMKPLPISEIQKTLNDLHKQAIDFWAEYREQEIKQFIISNNLKADDVRILKSWEQEIIFSVVNPLIKQVLTKAPKLQDQIK